MLSQEYFTHYPSRLLWAGGGILAIFTIVSGCLLIPITDEAAFPLPPRLSAHAEDSPLPDANTALPGVYTD